jgi:hypothetical protein
MGSLELSVLRGNVMKNRAILLAIAVISLLLSACGSDRREPLLKPPPATRMLVLGVSSDPIQMSAFEKIFANTIRTESQTVCLVGTGLPDLREGINAPTLKDALLKAHAQAVVINRVVPTDREDGREMGLDEYLQLAQDERSSWRNLQDGVLESRMFNVQSGQEIWRGHSRHFNPLGQLSELADASERLASKLAGSDAIPEPLERSES